ncbi:MAG: hypothetical protein PHU23_04545 [Dehalococcoidales bacterium]|nr:hypothetical protein [Dehalococcoidales bacterium]
MDYIHVVTAFIVVVFSTVLQIVSKLIDIITHHVPELAGVSTLITAIVTWCMVREIKKQRLSSQRPDIIIRESNYKIALVNSSSGGSRLHFEDGDVGLEIANIGNGHAKHIEIRWNYDLCELLRFLKKADTDKLYTFEFEHNSIMLTIKSCDPFNTIHAHGHVLTSQAKAHFRTMLRNVDSAHQLIQIPNAYLELYLVMVSLYTLNNPNHNTIFSTIDQFPKLSVNIKYFDIENNTYNTNYQIQFNPSAFSKPNISSEQNIYEISWGEIRTEEVK